MQLWIFEQIIILELKKKIKKTRMGQKMDKQNEYFRCIRNVTKGVEFLSQPKYKSKKLKQNETLREASDTLKDIRHHVQDNEFTLFGQQVGVQLNSLPLRKALEMQQTIQNLLFQARLNNLNYHQSSPNCSTPIPTTDVSTIRSRCDNFVSKSRDLHRDKVLMKL